MGKIGMCSTVSQTMKKNSDAPYVWKKIAPRTTAQKSGKMAILMCSNNLHHERRHRIVRKSTLLVCGRKIAPRTTAQNFEQVQ